MTQLGLAQSVPTTNALIADMQTKGLAMKRGGAEHMMAHDDLNRSRDHQEIQRKTKQEELKLEIVFLQFQRKQIKHQLMKLLKHL